MKRKKTNVKVKNLQEDDLTILKRILTTGVIIGVDDEILIAEKSIKEALQYYESIRQ